MHTGSDNMFFSLTTGKIDDHKGVVCWLSDGNLLMQETAVIFVMDFPLKEFVSFVDNHVHDKDSVKIQVEDFTFAFDAHDGSLAKTLSIYSSGITFHMSMFITNIEKFSQWLNEQADEHELARLG